MGLNEFSGVLWRERQLLDLLLFKLEEEQLILTSGRTQWLGHATREVETVLDQIREAELGRSVEADDAAREVGVPSGSSLHDHRRRSSRPVARAAHRAPRRPSSPSPTRSTPWPRATATSSRPPTAPRRRRC